MLTHLFGKNAIEQLFRRREDGVDEYIYKFDKFSFKYEEVLEKLLNCKNKDGNDFSIKQKFIENNLNLMFMDKNDCVSCLFVTDNTKTGFLVYSAGYNYPKYIAFISI